MPVSPTGQIFNTNTAGVPTLPPPQPNSAFLTPEQYQGVLTAQQLVSQPQIKLPEPPQDTTNYGGIIAGGQALSDLLKTPVQTPDLTSLYSQLFSQSGISDKETKSIESQKGLELLNAQMASLNAEAQAVPIQLQQESLGRGVTASGVAPIEADRLRSIALRSLPLQGQILAQQAIATGDQRALSYAQDKFSQVFQIQVQQAQMNYTAAKEQRDRIYDYLSKAEQNRINALQKEDDRKFQLMTNNINYAQTLSTTALENGRADIAAKITALDPKSPSYQSDLGRLAGTITPKPVPQPTPVVPTPTDIVKTQTQLALDKSKVDLISNLSLDKYLTSAVGPNALARISFTNFATGGKSNFIAGIEQVRSQLNLDALIQAKAQGATFGALSDQELKVLASSASKIGTWAVKDKNGNITGYKANEGDFRKELDKINNFAKMDYILKGGNPEDVGAKMLPDGTIWALNSDGTYTQLL